MGEPVWTGLYLACGCAGWRKGHPYDPQPHYIPVTVGQARRMLREALKPRKVKSDPPAVFDVKKAPVGEDDG